MITINEALDLDIGLIRNVLPGIDLSRTLLIDIETTGFSSAKNMIYMIGCIAFEGERALFSQYICENKADEYELLFEFSRLIEDIDTFIHFNGKSFDVPFIKRRMKLFMVASNIDDIKEIDVYVDARHVRRYLPLENLKLKSVEKYYNYKRSDNYDGGMLIKVFKDFIESKDEGLLSALKLHNKEDLIGLYYTLNLYYMINLLGSNRDDALFHTDIVDNSSEVELNYTLTYDCKFNLTLVIEDWQLIFEEKSIKIKAPIMHTTLKYFIPNYKDYYYLTLEGKVVHKSLASYVDTDYKEKATKENCYLLSKGSFIPFIPLEDKSIKTFSTGLNKKKYMQLNQNEITPYIILKSLLTQL